MKTPHTNIRLEGEVPKAVLKVVKEYFGKAVKVTKGDGDNSVDIFQSEEFKNIKKNMTPGKSIRANRELMGWTQEELGKKIKKSRHYVSDLENSRREVSKEMVKMFAKIFKTSTDAFL